MAGSKKPTAATKKGARSKASEKLVSIPEVSNLMDPNSPSNPASPPVKNLKAGLSKVKIAARKGSTSQKDDDMSQGESSKERSDDEPSQEVVAVKEASEKDLAIEKLLAEIARLKGESSGPSPVEKSEEKLPEDKVAEESEAEEVQETEALEEMSEDGDQDKALSGKESSPKVTFSEVGGSVQEPTAASVSKAEGKRKVVSGKGGEIAQRTRRKLSAEEEISPSKSQPEVRVFPKGVVVDCIWFASAVLADQWKIRKSWSIVAEKSLKEDMWNVPEVLTLIKEVGLLSTLTRPKPSNHQIVQEAAANVTENFGNPLHPEFGVLFVRQARVLITASIINEFFGLVDREFIVFPSLETIAEKITGGKVTKWEPNTSLKSNQLTSLYAVLHAFCTSNWIPTKNKQVVSVTTGKLIFAIGQRRKVDMGKIMFDNLALLGSAVAPKKYIGNPSLIYELIMTQAPEIRQPTERPANDLLPFKADHKLFSGDHIVDVNRLIPAKFKVKSEATGSSSKSGGTLHGPISKRVVQYLEQRLSEVKNEQRMVSSLLRDIKYPIEEDSQEGSDSEDESA